MPTKTRINGQNYTQLPRLVSDDVILKGLPQTAGAPDGYGDLAAAVNDLVDVVNVPAVNAELYQEQPIAITRVVKKAGNVVSTFGSGLWAASTGAPTLTQGFTGYDAIGNVIGVTPRTQPEMLLVEPIVNTTSRIVLSSPSTNIITKNLNGKFGLWVYVDLPAASLTTNISINVNFSTNPGAASEANSGIFGWTSTAVRQGWNFLVFVMRNPQAYVPASGVSETQFNGFSFTAFGTGAFNNIKDNNLTFLSIDIANGLNHKLYFDSIMTDFDSKSQIVFGCDAGPNLNEIAVPIFKSYGWKGYVAIPFRVHTTGSEIVSNMSTFFSNQVTTPYSEGWDVINHTLNHKDMTLMGAGKLKYEMLGVQAWYAQMGAVRGNEFYASPGSKSNKFASKVLRDLGFKMQRNTVHQCNYVTAWGFDETTEIGSVDFGSGTNPAFARITSGTKSDVIGWQQFSKMKEFVDLAIAYGCAIFPFWHGITTVGDDGSGEGLTGDPLLMYASSFIMICEYFREKELSGEIELCNFTQLYYGVKQ
jgi:hypothetical protein